MNQVPCENMWLKCFSSVQVHIEIHLQNSEILLFRMENSSSSSNLCWKFQLFHILVNTVHFTVNSIHKAVSPYVPFVLYTCYLKKVLADNGFPVLYDRLWIFMRRRAQGQNNHCHSVVLGNVPSLIFISCIKLEYYCFDCEETRTFSVNSVELSVLRIWLHPSRSWSQFTFPCHSAKFECELVPRFLRGVCLATHFDSVMGNFSCYSAACWKWHFCVLCKAQCVFQWVLLMPLDALLCIAVTA